MIDGFEWNYEKEADCISRRGICFEEAATVFADPLARIEDDPVHSEDEERYRIIGYSALGRLLIVWFTDREENIRIISARMAEPKEKRAYEQGQGLGQDV